MSRPPSAGTTCTSLTLLGSPSRGYQKAIFDPSGEKVGKPSSVVRAVSCRVAALATSATITTVLSPSPKCGSACFTNAMARPSGDQDSGEEGGPGGSLRGRLQLPEVSRRGSPPSAGVSQTCRGVGADSAR